MNLKGASVLEEYILKKCENFTLVMIVQGYMQMGKSTFVHYLLQNLSKRKFGKEWDFKKYCARDLEEFIDMIDKYNDKLLVFEEASKDISISKWYNDMNHFFNVIMQTQAYKHNLIVLVYPHSVAISKRQRYFINCGIEVTQRIDRPGLKAVILKPTLYRRSFYKLDEDDLYSLPLGSRRMFIKYNDKDLQKANEYTTWLEQTLKKDTINKIKRQLKQRREKIEDKKQLEHYEYPTKPIKINWF